MANSDLKVALERIHKNEYPTPVIQHSKEFFTKGFQINRCYVDDWDDIKDVFQRYSIEMNAHGPIITISQRKYVQLADKITQEIKKKPHLRNQVITGMCIGKQSHDAIVDSRLFITILRILPDFCRKYAEHVFIDWLATDNADKYVSALANMSGTIKSTEPQTDELLDQIVEAVKSNNGDK